MDKYVPGDGSFNARTNTCCPAGSAITNRYTCCPPNQIPQPDGTCVCPPVDTTDFNGSCVPPCPANMTLCSDGICSPCPAGQVGTSFGACCPANQTTSDGFCCPSGTYAQRGSCVPATAMIRPPNNCPPGTTRQDNGACTMTQPVITPETPGLTPPPAPPSPPVPSRLCSAGETMLRDGDCCPSAQVTPRGVCCTSPYLPAADGTCRRPPQQRPAEIRCAMRNWLAAARSIPERPGVRDAGGARPDDCRQHRCAVTHQARRELCSGLRMA